MPAASTVRPSSSSRPTVARVSVANETRWPITVHLAGSRPDAGVLIAPGEDATLALAVATGAALAVSARGRRRAYALDLDLLGFDTVHVRTEDLVGATC